MQVEDKYQRLSQFGRGRVKEGCFATFNIKGDNNASYVTLKKL